MLTPLHNPAQGRLRVIGYASGSGNTLWKAYETQKRMEEMTGDCPFEVVGLFSDDLHSKAVAYAKQVGLPYAAIDIRAFYKERGVPLKDREVRAAYDAAALEQIRAFGGDCVLLAGYVWATTDIVADEYMMINVHPADLTIEREGRRAFAGANGVGDTLAAREPAICATAHLATKEIDGGPILIVSERVPIDYALHADDDSRMRHYLKLVNEQNRLAGERALLEIAEGHFARDDDGTLHYKGKPAPQGVRIESWQENKPLFERSMDKLLNPHSVAVIGASNKPGIGRSIVENLVRDGFAGALYAVNLRGEDVLTAKGCASIGDIEGAVDLAIIATPGTTVLEIAEACGQKGVGAIICISAGFKEIGDDAAQDALVAIVNRYNMRMIGPNCMGEMNRKAKLNATILHNRLIDGHVAFVTQSGAIGAAMLDFAEGLGLGFSSIVSLGNQADVTACDLLPHYDQDEYTRVIALYLESIPDPVRFARVAARVKKPILVLKAGGTDAGSAAASSHTGSLAGNDALVDALLRKAGVTRVASLEDLFLTAAALSHMPPMQGNRVALLTNAGGPGILIADALCKAGFELPPTGAELREELRAHLMREAATANPIDVVAPAPSEHYVFCAEKLLQSAAYDALLICCVPPATVDTAAVARALVPVVQGAGIPVMACFFGPTLGGDARRILIDSGIPTCDYPEQLATMLSGMRTATPSQAREASRLPAQALHKAQSLLQAAPNEGYLASDDAYALLACCGIDAAKSALIGAPSEVDGLELHYPVVAKIDHPEIVHKSDVGGVVLHIGSREALREVTSDLLERFPGARGVFVQEQVSPSFELIVGGTRDPQTGHSVMVGMGGVFVEVLKDVAFGLPPFDHADARAMIARLRCEPLLSGVRGVEGVDLDALAELLVKVGDVLLALPSIAEFDMNPVLYDPTRGFVAVDARIKKA